MIKMIPVCFPLNLLARGSEKDEDLMTKKLDFHFQLFFMRTNLRNLEDRLIIPKNSSYQCESKRCGTVANCNV